MTLKKNIIIAAATLLIATGLGALYYGMEKPEYVYYQPDPINSEDVPEKFRNEPIQPVPMGVKVNLTVAALGKKLFHDPRLSADDSISCANCHNLGTAGVDGRRYSIGINGIQEYLNTPTIFNSGLNPYQFWDGRAASLEQMINEPPSNIHKMGSNWNDVIQKLKRDSTSRHDFAAAFEDGLTSNNIAHAIAEFERTLATPNARFDQFLRGKDDAITPQEKQGYHLFKSYGCATCHQGVAVGGNMFERMGSVRRYFDDYPPRGSEDLGRYNVTHDEKHRYYFRVPSLRNVEKTAPYFHNGSAKTLEEAVKVMGFYNLGVRMPESDVALIVQFLKTLTGEYEGRQL